MQVDVSFPFAKIFNIPERVDAVLGQKFSLLTDSGINLLWFASGDKVLSIIEGSVSADLEATALGSSVIHITDTEEKLVRRIVINVVQAIVEEANNLNATAGQPILKDVAPDESLDDLLK